MLIFTFLALYLCMAAIFQSLILRLVTSNHISSSGLVHGSQISCSVPRMVAIFITFDLSMINRLLAVNLRLVLTFLIVPVHGSSYFYKRVYAR